MIPPLEIQVNGKVRSLGVESPAMLSAVVLAMELRADRIAVEQNGRIVPRARWAETPVRPGDRLEIVHFVGGGRE